MASASADITFGVDDRPPPVQLALLAVQYAFLVCVYLVIVVIVVRAAAVDESTARSVVSMALVAIAAGTALQALHGWPVGSGFLAPPVYSAIYLGPSILAAKAGGLPAVAGMTVVAGLTELATGAALRHLRPLTQPTIGGLTICIIAFELGVIGLQHALDVGGEGHALFGAHVLVAGVTFAVAVGFTVWGRGVWKLVCSLLGLLAGIAAALVLGVFDGGALARLAAEPWFAVPDPGYIAFRWDAALLPAFLAAGLAATIRTVGVVTTCQKANDPAWTRPDLPNIRRGVFADGLGCVAGGLVSAPGMNIAPSIVGVSIATGVTARVVAFAAAAVLAGLAFVPRVAAFFLELPLPVAGALLVFTASIMLASGMQLMLVRPLDTRLTFVVGLGLLFPLTAMVSQGYFADLPRWLAFVADSHLALGLGAAVALLLVFRIAPGRRRTILWAQTTDAMAELGKVLAANARAWQLTDAVVARGLDAAQATVTRLHEADLVREPVSIAARGRDAALEIELRYRGEPLFLADLSGRQTEHEEAAVAAGLHAGASAGLPDRASTSVRRGETTIRLGFDV